MRVRLKGINRVTKRLADGRTVTYYYAWKGGPRLDGAPGSPEFMASYERAVQTRPETAPGTLLSILNAYQASAEFTALAPRTRADYVGHIRRIEDRFGTFPLPALSDRRSRAVFLSWRDELATKSRRQADYAYTVLARVISWAHHRGLVTDNPLERSGRLYRGTRADKIWTPDDEAALVAKANSEMRLAFGLALNTGQRQGDLLRLPWSAYDGARIRLTQNKTGVRVSIPVTEELKALLDAAPRRCPTLLTNRDGRPWTPAGFSSSWRKLLKRAGITGLTFNDLRGTAATRLALAGCDHAQISAITGHTMGQVGAILDRHYLSRTALLADEAISRLEHNRGTKSPNQTPNRGKKSGK